MTYEKSKAPADAPVTWLPCNDPSFGCHVEGLGLFVRVADAEEADAICRAFHLAKLAEEMRAMVERAPLCPPGTTEWKRRFDAIKETT